jgi:hypothetical protein
MSSTIGISFLVWRSDKLSDNRIDKLRDVVNKAAGADDAPSTTIRLSESPRDSQSVAFVSSRPAFSVPHNRCHTPVDGFIEHTAHA